MEYGSLQDVEDALAAGVDLNEFVTLARPSVALSATPPATARLLGPHGSAGSVSSPRSSAGVIGARFAHGLARMTSTDRSSTGAGHYTPRYTLLMYAAGNGETAAVQRLLSEDSVRVNRASLGGQTALYFAAQNGHVACVQLLIDACANVNQEDASGFSPMYMAALLGKRIYIYT
jgi:hypothetical protein